MNTQLRKGVIELCILALIAQKDMYGYDIVRAMEKYTDINEGTVYPILRRLTKDGYFATYLVESDSGPQILYHDRPGTHLSEKEHPRLGGDYAAGQFYIER